MSKRAFAAILNDLLIHDQFRPGAAGLTVRDAQRHHLFQSRSRDRVTFFAGLAESVAACLIQRGYQVAIEPAVRLRFDVPHDDEHSDSNRSGFARATLGRQRSLIKISNDEERLDHLQTICLRHCEEHVLVVTPNTSTARAAAHAMRHRTCWPTSYGVCESRAEPWLHFVSVMGFLDRSYAIWPITVFWDAGLVTSRTAVEQLMFMHQSIRYAFLDHKASINLPDRLMIEGVFGPVLDVNAIPGGNSVNFAWLSPPAYSAGDDHNALERKRSKLWHNASRNRQIAEAASAIHGRDTRKLRRLGLGGIFAEVDLSQSSVVAILVESPEHGRALLRYLRAWELEHVGATASHDVNRSAIMTLARAETAPLLADVLIFAAGTGCFWRADREPASSTFYSTNLTVIDVEDDFDEQAKREVAARAGCYRRFGWRELG